MFHSRMAIFLQTVLYGSIYVVYESVRWTIVLEKPFFEEVLISVMNSFLNKESMF